MKQKTNWTLPKLKFSGNEKIALRKCKGKPQIQRKHKLLDKTFKSRYTCMNSYKSEHGFQFFKKWTEF